jgi:hypothetical protein
MRLYEPALNFGWRGNEKKRPPKLAKGDQERVKFRYMTVRKKELYSDEGYHITRLSPCGLCKYDVRS